MMTDDQKKLAAIITAKMEEATAQLRYELEKELLDQAMEDNSTEASDTFYHMDHQLDKLAKRYGRAIAMKASVATVHTLIDELTGTSS